MGEGDTGSVFLNKKSKSNFFWEGGGGGRRGEWEARVSEFFVTKYPHQKYCFLEGGWGEGGGARVSAFSFTKDPNLKQKYFFCREGGLEGVEGIWRGRGASTIFFGGWDLGWGISGGRLE